MKKGFTLIELLAVIIILAIIALIATPIILNAIDDAKKSAGLSEANMIYSGIDNYCAVSAMRNELDGSNDICSDGVTTEEVSSMINLGNAEVTKISYSNSKITELVLNSNGYTYTLEADGSFSVGESKDPETPESVSFALDSWETIAKIVKLGKAEEVYNVGDTKEVTVEGYTNGSEQTFTVRIANISTPEECNSEGFSQTACGFVVEFVDIITENAMNSTSTTKGGWPASEMYSFVNDTIYNALPSDLRNVIIDTYTVSGYGSDDVFTSSNFTSTDKLYLLTVKEVYGSNISYDTVQEETRQLDYYKNNGVTEDNYSGAIKMYEGSADDWWLRSANSDMRGFGFYYVNTSGNWTYDISTLTNGVAPAFRIG